MIFLKGGRGARAGGNIHKTCTNSCRLAAYRFLSLFSPFPPAMMTKRMPPHSHSFTSYKRLALRPLGRRIIINSLLVWIIKTFITFDPVAVRCGPARKQQNKKWKYFIHSKKGTLKFSTLDSHGSLKGLRARYISSYNTTAEQQHRRRRGC